MPRDGPINARLVDLPSKFEHQFQFAADQGFPIFLSLLTHVSGQVTQHLQGVANPPAPDHGFTTSDGPWWYRIAKSNGSYKPLDGEDNGNPTGGAWRILNSAAAFDFMINDMTFGVDTEGGWVEIEHVSYQILFVPDHQD